MSVPFFIISAITIAGTLGVLCLRQTVHSVLSLTIVFAGLAMMYLQLGAEFIGFAQFLVYIGAVSILILFAILLTKNSGPALDATPFSSSWVSGIAVFILILATLFWAVKTPISQSPTSISPPLVKVIGKQLMSDYVIPLEALALFLTAAMMGAIVIAMNESSSKSRSSNSSNSNSSSSKSRSSNSSNSNSSSSESSNSNSSSSESSKPRL